MLLHTFFFGSEFGDFLRIGWDHIIDIKAYDHLLFVMVLCAAFNHTEWRKILVIITAFTIGHSLTLALSALDYIFIPADTVEILIPLTIFATAIANVARKKPEKTATFDNRLMASYIIALVFGLIHGLGFANNFRFFLGEDSSILLQLFAFNTGLELGQVAVVIGFMGLLWLFTKFTNLAQREWALFISGAGAGVSLILILENLS